MYLIRSRTAETIIQKIKQLKDKVIHRNKSPATKIKFGTHNYRTYLSIQKKFKDSIKTKICTGIENMPRACNGGLTIGDGSSPVVVGNNLEQLKLSNRNRLLKIF